MNDIRHNDTHHKHWVSLGWVTHFLIVMLNVVMLGVIVLSAMAPSMTQIQNKCTASALVSSQTSWQLFVLQRWHCKPTYREPLLKGKAQYSWAPCTNKFRSGGFHIENIIYLWYKTSYLNEEVNCIEPSPSARVPGHLYYFLNVVASSADCLACLDRAGNTKRGKYHCTIDLLFDWFGISYMTNDNFCFCLKIRLIQTSQTEGHYADCHDADCHYADCHYDDCH